MFIKICGTTSEDDASLAVALGADAVGFVFAPSRRQIAPQIAGDIIKRLPPEILTIGVFRDAGPEQVMHAARVSGVKGVQLHGHEPPRESRWLKERLPVVIKAFAAGDGAVAAAAEYGVDAVLLDAASPGSGQVFDWALASEVPTGQRLIIAGGLDPDNVAAALARTRPWGVDVASGVERAPGAKDPIRLREFIAAARAAGEGVASGDVPADPAGTGAVADRAEGDTPYDWEEIA
jgi:phosphoribosylanthranilate isomerase